MTQEDYDRCAQAIAKAVKTAIDDFELTDSIDFKPMVERLSDDCESCSA